MSRAVSTWSLHRTLGSFFADDPAPGSPSFTPSPPGAGLALLDLPAALRQRGYDTVQICHFHFPSRDPGYLSELKSALADADIELDAVLIDDGDPIHPSEADDHEVWIGGWLDDAVTLGARRARVIAGKSAPTPERLAESARRLGRLAASHPDVRVVTENWRELLPTAAEVRAVLQPNDGAVGLLIDLGNWSGPSKYDELAAVAALAETCHAKCRFDSAGPDTADFRQSLQILRSAGYDGPLALIYDGPDDDEWAALDQEDAVVRAVFTAS